MKTRLAQSVERQPFKLVVEGLSPSSGELFLFTSNFIIDENLNIIMF